MFGLLAAVSGAAAIEINKIRGKGGKDEAELTKLREKEDKLRKKLERVQRKLSDTLSLNEQTSTKLADLTSNYESVQQEASALKVEKAGLEEQAASLASDRDHLAACNAELDAQRISLQRSLEQVEAAKRNLELENDALKHSGEESSALLDTLKQKVSALLDSYFVGDVDVSAVIREMNQLGCELQFTEEQAQIMLADRASTAGGSNDTEFGSKFVLDSPSKMRHLIQAALQQQQAVQQPALLLSGGAPAMTSTLRLPDIGRPGANGDRQFNLSWRQASSAAASASGQPQALAGLQQPVQQQAAAVPQLEQRITPRDAPPAASDTAKAPKAAAKAALEGDFVKMMSSPSKAKAEAGRFSLFSLGGSVSRRGGGGISTSIVGPEDDGLPLHGGRDLARF